MKSIHLRGVEQNNLKNIDVDIPLGSFTVVCGPSGSGKSSLAFETLYAEGQRRYIESLSSYARQFLNKAPQPKVESIQNVPPAIAIEQKNHVKTSRSTVGTVTEVVDYLRLLFAKIGKPHCPEHKMPLESVSVTMAADRIVDTLNGKRGYILSKVYKEGRSDTGKKLLQKMIRAGFTRLYTEKKVIDLTPTSPLPTADFFILVDRMAFSLEERGRVADSVSQAYSASLLLNDNLQAGEVFIVTTDGAEIKYSESQSCDICGFTVPPLSPQLFNFSSPVGACQTCNGFGNLLTLDEDKVVPNPSRTLAEGALAPFAMPSATYDRRELVKFCKKMEIDLHTPWKSLTAKEKALVWKGNKDFYGVEGLFDYLEEKKYKMHVRVFISRFKSPYECKDCGGTRLRKESHAVLLSKKNLSQVSQMTIEDLIQFFKKLAVPQFEKDVSKEILKQIESRLKFLFQVGVGYLTMDRPTRTLSGGEYQRINLANQLGMELSQTLYVLDEPTVGLHPRDNDRLIEILKGLKDLGNTLVVVEHDRDVIRNSDYVLELGPGSGHLGGEIIYSGTTKNFIKENKTLTAHYLNEDDKWVPPRDVRPVDINTYKYKIELEGCSGHNLQNVDVAFPLNRMVAVTGVSGSGKSSLVTQTLFPALIEKQTGEKSDCLPFKRIYGAELVKEVLFIDQKPVGRSSRSNPVTYLKVFDEIRSLMASTSMAKDRGYGPGHFSLNVDGGRCPDCKGDGFILIDMAFMDDVTLLCESCQGKRYKKELLQVKYKNKNVNEILNLTVSEAMDFFVSSPAIRRPLQFLKEVGLDYIRLGQSSQSLSGGESQRLKVAKELSNAKQKATLYILDEPTTGLHPREVRMLVNVLHRLIDAGNSVIVIEHNIDVITSSDYVIEIGPDGGVKGGKIMFQGSTQDLSRAKDCATSPYIRAFYESGSATL